MKKIKKRLFAVLIFFLIFSAQNTFADVNTLDLEIIYQYGDWDKVTPFFLETTNKTHRVIAQVNATNINSTEPLDSLQYLHYIFNYVNYSEPESGLDNNTVYFSMRLVFGSDIIWIEYDWELIWEIFDTFFKCTVRLYEGVDKVLEYYDFGLDDTQRPEIYFWRSKSDQPVIQIHTGDQIKRHYFSVFDDWDLSHIWYQFMTLTGTEMEFTVRFDDFGYQAGSDDGISDPVSNENWGIFEPIRQILIFVMKLFIGLIKIILPSALEDAFDDFIVRLGDVLDPVMEIFRYIIDNFVDLIILIHLALIAYGLTKATEGDIKEVVMPIWTFYSIIGTMMFSILGFIMSIIKTIIGLLPF